jgi:hypothetical protein
VSEYPQWDAVREDWLPGDGLRDINFPDAWVEPGVDDVEWQRLVDWIWSRPEWTATYTEDGEAVEMPDVRTVMERFERVSPLLQINIGRGVIANGYFAPGEIEFDVDPREVGGQDDFALVCDFLRSIGDVVGRRVDVSVEGSTGPVLMSFEPSSGELTYSLGGDTA